MILVKNKIIISIDKIVMDIGHINLEKKKLRVDASGKLIIDPETADRNYDESNDNQNNETDNNYYKFCGYYSVPYEGGPFKRLN